MLADFIQILNTDEQLYRKLRQITDSDEVLASLSEEERMLAADLRLELEREGIHLPEGDREASSLLASEVSPIDHLVPSMQFDLIANRWSS